MKVLKGEHYLSCIKSCMMFTDKNKFSLSDVIETHEQELHLNKKAVIYSN